MPLWYPEREMTPVFAPVMEIGLLMCGVCFYPSVLFTEQSADHFDDVEHSHVSFHKLKAPPFFFALFSHCSLFTISLSFSMYTIQCCIYQSALSWDFNPSSQTLRRGKNFI
jgi:hypothetical protein